MPRVSVVMAVYNEERYLQEAIDSILRQTFTDFEFVIVDDGSTDRTPHILEAYRDSRLRVYRQTNQGQSTALNQGIRFSSGSYIARMDGDDVSRPERIEKEVCFLDGHPGVGLVGTWCQKIDTRTGQKRFQSFPTNNASIRRFMRVDNPFVHSSVMIRESVLGEVGLYDPRLIWQDYDLWVRMAGHCQMANIPEALIIRRKHPANLTATSRKSREFRERFTIQWRAARRLGLSGEGAVAMTKSLAAVVGYGMYGC